MRHRAEHLITDLVKSHNAAGVARADSLLDDVREGEDRADRLYRVADAIMERALKAGDLRTALQANRTASSAVGQWRAYQELRAGLTRELEEAQRPKIFTVLVLPKQDGVPMRAPAKAPQTAQTNSSEIQQLNPGLPRISSGS